MKASGTFTKGNQLKAYEVSKIRGERSLQKYLNAVSQGKQGYKVYTTKTQSKNTIERRIKNCPQIISISSSNIPVISSFQKKIREAIQVRYKKSKINEFKYKRLPQFGKERQSSSSSLTSDPKHSILEDSQESEDMDKMKQFAYLNNQSYISIYQYHASKSNLQKESAILKENIRKRKFKFVNSKSIQAKDHLLNNHAKSIQKIPLKVQQELNSLSPKQSKPMHVNFKGLNQKHEKGSDHDEEKRKTLTSRPTDIHHQITQFTNSDVFFDQIQPKSNTKTYMIKDTFKLKGQNKFNTNKDQQKQPQEEYINMNPSNYGDEKSGRSLNNKRRLLLQRNQTKQRTFQTQINQQSSKKLNSSYQHQSIPKTENKKVFSMKKIETQLIQKPQMSEKKTPAYKKTTKERTKMKTNYTHDFQNNEGQMTPSTKEHKWKLQQISFRFKATNEQKTQFPVEKMNNFIQQNEKALRVGLSLEKAYNKILSGRTVERNQTSNMDNKRTIIPKNEQNSVYTTQTIVDERQMSQMDRQQRSISKNKRRKLRLRTEADFEPNNRNSQAISTQKNSNKNIQSPINSTIIQNLSRESMSQLKEKQKREFITTSYRSRQKVEKFSTIS